MRKFFNLSLKRASFLNNQNILLFSMIKLSHSCIFLSNNDNEYEARHLNAMTHLLRESGSSSSPDSELEFKSGFGHERYIEMCRQYLTCKA